MPGFLGAHGYDPGPTQRPLLAGALAGLIATIPALAILSAFRSLKVEAAIFGWSQAGTVGVGLPLMAAAGAIYGRLFGRAANEATGGWLFGMSFGFALWASGAVMIIPIATGGIALAGRAAIGTFLSLVTWGAALGGVYPRVHRPLHESIDSAARRIGPSETAGRSEPRPRRRP